MKPPNITTTPHDNGAFNTTPVAWLQAQIQMIDRWIDETSGRSDADKEDALLQHRTWLAQSVARLVDVGASSINANDALAMEQR
ncbi:MAG: hypothetical protein AAGJ87_16800 [Pseudomonadota bacterium]